MGIRRFAFRMAKKGALCYHSYLCTKFKSIFYIKFNWRDWVCSNSCWCVTSLLLSLCHREALCVCLKCTYVFGGTWIFISNSSFFIAFASANQWIASQVATVLYDFAHLIRSQSDPTHLTQLSTVDKLAFGLSSSISQI